MTTPLFKSIVFDFDSTLSSLEGVEWIAAQLGPEVARAIAAEVDAAMSGTVALEELYAARMDRLRPNAEHLAALGDAYRAQLAPGASAAIRRFREAGVTMHIVSGGFREAIMPAARQLGFDAARVHAVSIRTAPDGSYVGYDTESPLITQLGKPGVVAGLKLPVPSMMVGDGATDAAVRGVVTSFVAYAGFARRENVVAVADHVVTSYAELEQLVLR